ncbi:MAG: hypothetical protein WAO74_06360 [Polaribacter sp.]|uniref:hypothetical protein n=1 Tax=Polaribacter sp. TaxID=1920175 RepID=UPI003BB01AC5
MKNSILVLLFVSLFLACSTDEDENPCENLPTNATEITTAYFSAGLVFGSNPTSANCVSFKAASEAYITYGNSIKDCLDADDKAELEIEISELRADLDELDCN